MSFINYVRIVSPDGETWENYSRRKWGVQVVRWHGWFDGKREKAWTKILSRADASLRWRSLKAKGWKETVRSNPSSKIGEWWIDESGKALYADGDVGDMGHEAYVVSSLTRRLLDAMDIDRADEEYIGDLNDGKNRRLITQRMKEEDFNGVIEEFVEQAAKKIWKNEKQREDVLRIIEGQGDARKYGMQYDGWIRVAGHGLECWNLDKDVMQRMADGIYDAMQDQEIADDEEFEIYVHNTGTHYTHVPWVLINEGDPGALRMYGTKNNPPNEFFKTLITKTPTGAAHALIVKFGTQAAGWAKTILSSCTNKASQYYWRDVLAETERLIYHRNPGDRTMSYAQAHAWEPLAKARGVSVVARSGRGFMRAYQRAGTLSRLSEYWQRRRAAFIARHMAQVRQNKEKLWVPDRSGKLRPSRRCLALMMWAYKPA